MLSKAKIKYVRSLNQKKYRKQECAFVAEGPKTVEDLLHVMPAREIFATRGWLEGYSGQLEGDTVHEISDDELARLSFLQHPQKVLAVFALPERQKPVSVDTGKLSLALDGVQDPGNLGTIIRIADWFGIENIYCSEDTADAYNPKVVQATMGSIARVKLFYADLTDLIRSLPKEFPVYGTMLDGDNIYTKRLSANGLVVMGNEGKGISPQVAKWIGSRLLIPNFPESRDTADSLNVAIATAVICAEFRRQQYGTGTL